MASYHNRNSSGTLWHCHVHRNEFSKSGLMDILVSWVRSRFRDAFFRGSGRATASAAKELSLSAWPKRSTFGLPTPSLCHPARDSPELSRLQHRRPHKNRSSCLSIVNVNDHQGEKTIGHGHAVKRCEKNHVRSDQIWNPRCGRRPNIETGKFLRCLFFIPSIFGFGISFTNLMIWDI